MPEPDRLLLILNEIRARLTAMDARMTSEFSEVHDRLRRLDERMDGITRLADRVDALERR